MKKVVALLMGVLILVTCITGCKTAPKVERPDVETRTITDMVGREVAVPVEVTSYVDLWYSHQSILAMLDVCEHMAFTSYERDNAFCAWFFEMFPNVKESPIEEMNVEELLNLGVQVAFVQYSERGDFAEELEQAGIAAVAVDFDSYDSLMKSITMVADVLNTDEARNRAEQFNTELSKTMSDIGSAVSQIPDNERVRVLNLRNLETLRADGADTVADAWITACGGINVVAADGLSGNQYLNAEQIFQWNPDIIFSSAAGDAEWVYAQSDYDSLSAVHNHRFYDNPSGIFYWNRYSAETILQLKWASSLFYPERFEAEDIRQIIKDFYKEFYNYEISEENIDQMLKGLTPIGWGK